MYIGGGGGMSPSSIVVSAACGVAILRIVLSLKSLIYLLGRWWRWLDERAQVYQYFEIPKYIKEGGGSGRQEEEENPLYRKAAAYVASLPSLEDADAAAISSSARKPNDFALHLAPRHSAHDSYLGARLSWSDAGAGALVLRVRRQDRTRVLRPYLQHVESVADEIELRRRGLRLFTNSPGGGGGWSAGAAFAHPATLDAVAMDAELKARVRADLEAFLKGRAYYHRLGRVWRRSYLLYGAPGTGKSSFAAAMARFLGYDVYDLDLARAPDPRALLLRTTPRSLILVEDLDRHLAAPEPEPERRLTGILGFMDGIFSCCGDERVMVFTMSGAGGKETLDPAVLRPGRLDVHIHFPLCDFAAFKTLASSYLGLRDHKLYPQVEEGFQSGARLSPAEVGEIMIANRGSPSRAIKSVISALLQQQQQQQLQASNCGPRSSTVGRRLNESWSARKFDEIAHGDGGPSGLGLSGENTLKEFKKLYGFLKIRSGSRKEGTIAAAAAATAANGNNMNGVDHNKEW